MRISDHCRIFFCFSLLHLGGCFAFLCLCSYTTIAGKHWSMSLPVNYFKRHGFKKFRVTIDIPLLLLLLNCEIHVHCPVTCVKFSQISIQPKKNEILSVEEHIKAIQRINSDLKSEKKMILAKITCQQDLELQQSCMIYNAFRNKMSKDFRDALILCLLKKKTKAAKSNAEIIAQSLS